MSGQSGDDYTVNDHEAAGRAHDTLPLSIMTWNIWQGTLLDQIMETVTRIKPDVLALQEVIEEHGDDGRRNDAAVIAAALGREYRHIYYPAVSTRRGVHAATQGNAIISRHAIEEHESHFLSPPERHRGDAESEPRIAVMATLDVRGRPLHVLTTHLAYSEGFAPSEMRRRQIDVLLPLVPDARAVLLGDFNSLPDSVDVRRIGSVIPHAARDLSAKTYCSYPRLDLRQRIDYIFATPDLTVASCDVLAEAGSDHLPVLAVLAV